MRKYTLAIMILLSLALLKLEYWYCCSSRYLPMSVGQLEANKNELYGAIRTGDRLFLNLTDMFGFNKFPFLKKSVNPRPEYKFFINPWIHNNFSKSAQVNWSMVVIIESAPDNFLRRQAIRETWASSKARSIVNILAVFILGTMDNKTTQQALIEEDKQYGDILQMDKEDIYRHVTHKSLAAIQWTGENFPSHWIYSLSGDDVYLDVVKYRNEIERMIEDRRKELRNVYSKGEVEYEQVLRELPIYCSYKVHEHVNTVRDKSNKYYVSESEYPYEYYPTYCAGPFYSMSIHKALALLENARYLVYCWMEDAWVTGVVRLVEQTKNGVIVSEYEKNNNVFEIGIRASFVTSPAIHISELDVDDIVQYIKEQWKKIEA